MGIEIQDGRGGFYQWDIGRKLTVDNGAEQVHFQNREHGNTVDVDVVDGVAAVPDILLQAARPLRVFAYIVESDGCYTKLERVFEVTERNKPIGYVYTPTDARNFSQLQKQIGALEDLKTTAKDNLVAAVNEVTEMFGGAAELGSSVVLNANTEYRGGEMATLSVMLPVIIPDNYTSRLVFESGATATTLSYPADTIKFIGDGCDSEGDFVPAASTSYEVDIKYLGTNSAGVKRLVARVGAF